MAAFQSGTVVRYDSERRDGHCREGMAIADDRGVVYDTFWEGGTESHVLTESELATAQPLFHLQDYRELSHTERYTWRDYHPDDRQTITAQHGLRVRYFVRLAAGPHLGTRIQNAREAVREAEAQVESAQSALAWRREELARLESTDVREVTP